MPRFTLIALALALSALPAAADPCDDLIRSLEGAMSSPGTSADQKNQLEALLNAGKAAKAAGDTAACSAAMTGGQSPMPRGGPGGNDCEKTQDKTV